MNRFRRQVWRWVLPLATVACIPSLASAVITVRDDNGNNISLQHPAHRIVSLAPYTTELLFAAGAGDFIVGTLDYSDFPEAAKKIRRVGSGAGVDLELIVTLRPDLIVAWRSGNPPWQIARLQQLGLTVFVTEQKQVDDVPAIIERLGKLTGTSTDAAEASRKFRNHAAELRRRYANRSPVKVFYQILDASLFTVNGAHLISDVLRLCGGRNVFADFPVFSPSIGIEAVLQKNPEAILASGPESLWSEWRSRWHAWPTLTAVKRDNLFFIPPDLIHRNGPRILEGAEQVCQALEQARRKPAAKKTLIVDPTAK